MQLARLISSQCKGQMVNHWSPDQLQVTWPPSVLMYFFSSWTVFFTIYPMQFLSWLDSKASWHSIFSQVICTRKDGAQLITWSAQVPNHLVTLSFFKSISCNFPNVSLNTNQMHFCFWSTSIWLTCPADHSPDRLISPRGATSDCSELTNISRSCLFVIPAPDWIPFLLWNLQHILVAFIPVLIEILLLH